MSLPSRTALAAAAALLLSSGAVHAHHGNRAPGAPATSSVQVELSDAALQDQTGRTVRLASDVVGRHLVVIDFVYTSCTTVCPILSAIFGQVQERLGQRLGREVRLVSLSVDPVRDTPARLADYAEHMGAQPGWTFLTGPKTVVDGVLEKLGAYAPDVVDHPSMVLVGDPVSGRWSRFFGFVTPDTLLGAVDALAAQRVAAH